ncbi:MAG: hypothetical protein KDB03_15615 [Planctomycetales bacterium]|nr:hypothetical protein [Planctomycetales bacterium]
MCLAVVLEALDIDYSYADLLGRLGRPFKDGFPISTLAEVSESYGLNVRLVKTNFESLQLRRKRGERFACICLIDDKHFLLCNDIQDDTAFVIDPPNTYERERAAFEAMWAGHALLISNGTLVSEEELIGFKISWLSVWGAIAVSTIICMGTVYLLKKRLR